MIKLFKKNTKRILVAFLCCAFIANASVEGVATTTAADTNENSGGIEMPEISLTPSETSTPAVTETPGAEITETPEAVVTPGAKTTEPPKAVVTPGAETTEPPNVTVTPGAKTIAEPATNASVANPATNAAVSTSAAVTGIRARFNKLVGMVIRHNNSSYMYMGDQKLYYYRPYNRKVTETTVEKEIIIDEELYKVVGISSKAFKKCKLLKKVIVKTPYLKKKTIGKAIFKFTKKNLVVKVPKNKKKLYTKLFKKKGNSKLKIKKL